MEVKFYLRKTFLIDNVLEDCPTFELMSKILSQFDIFFWCKALLTVIAVASMGSIF
jgi:hypothetical protein